MSPDLLSIVANLSPAVAVALILCFFGWKMVKILAKAIDNLSDILQDAAKENREANAKGMAEVREMQREHDTKMSERNKTIFDILAALGRDVAIIKDRTDD